MFNSLSSQLSKYYYAIHSANINKNLLTYQKGNVRILLKEPLPSEVALSNFIVLFAPTVIDDLHTSVLLTTPPMCTVTSMFTRWSPTLRKLKVVWISTWNDLLNTSKATDVSDRSLPIKFVWSFVSSFFIVEIFNQSLRTIIQSNVKRPLEDIWKKHKTPTLYNCT